MQTTDLRDRLRSTLVEFTWSQWAQMGLSAAPSRGDRWAMDPEALLLFTLHVARRDPRLFDEVLDWLRENGRLVGVQRVRNLAKDDEMSRRLANVALAWAGRHNPTLRGWSSEDSSLLDSPREDLFLTDAGDLLAAEPDEQF